MTTMHNKTKRKDVTAPRQRMAKRKDEWIWPFFKQYKKPLILALALGLLTSIFASALMFTSGYLIARAAEMPGTILMIHLPLVFVRIFGIGKPFLQYIERLMSHDWVLRMTSGMRSKLYNTLEGDGVFAKRKHRTGNILGLLTEDIGHLQNLYLRVVFPTIVAWLVYVVVVIAAGFFSWCFALAMLVLLGVCVVLMPLVSLLANRAKQARQASIKHELYNELTDDVLGVSDWIFAGRGKEYLQRYQSTEDELAAIDAWKQRFARRRDLGIRVVYAAVVIVILAWSAGAFGGAAGGAANWIAACILAFFPLIDVFGPVPDAAADAVIYQESGQHLNELSEQGPAGIFSSTSSVDSCPEQTHDACPKQEADSCPEQTHDACPDRKSAESTDATIQIENLSFTYPATEHPVLRELNLTIKPGEKVALLGRSGGGKSTLAALIRGDLMPTGGSVTLGSIASHDYGDDISAYIGVIQQQTYLFKQTLLENLRIGNKDASEDEVLDALEKVGLKSLVERLPKGLHTMVSEGGHNFSGGERHRIALARVLLRNVPIVLLDEPMVGLDPLTEQALLNTMLKAFADKTVIMITHHLAGVAQMDRAVFIEKGTVALCGSPSELERTNEYYQKLLAFDC